MNGRVYDATLARFISADPHIQAPHMTQSYNRYSYVINNPMKYTDPSGFFFKRLWNTIVEGFKEIGRILSTAIRWVAVTAWRYRRVIASIAVSFAVSAALGWIMPAAVPLLLNQMISGAAVGFAGSYVATGDLRSAAIGAIGGAYVGLAAGAAVGTSARAAQKATAAKNAANKAKAAGEITEEAAEQSIKAANKVLAKNVIGRGPRAAHIGKADSSLLTICR